MANSQLFLSQLLLLLYSPSCMLMGSEIEENFVQSHIEGILHPGGKDAYAGT